MKNLFPAFVVRINKGVAVPLVRETRNGNGTEVLKKENRVKESDYPKESET